MPNKTAEPSPAWKVELFGGLRAVCDGQEVSRFRTRKTASLFAYLSFFCDRSHPREILVDLFWPDVNLDAGRQSLRMALSSLREVLGVDHDTVLEADRNVVRLKNVTSDVFEFEQSALSDDASVLASALKRVKGPLLAGFDDSWIVAQWLRLEETYAQTAARLMEARSVEGDFKAGILTGKEAVGLLGPREDIHLALMKLYAADGQTGQAIAQFEVLERQLDDEWGETPSSAAYDFLDSLPKSSRAPSGTRKAQAAIPARTSSFLGRTREVEEVTTFLRSGSNRLVTLLGAGGCGKTALANVVATGIAESMGERVWIVELADVKQSGRILDVIHQRAYGHTDVTVSVSSLCQAIGDEHAVFVLDNLEQLLPQGAVLVKELLESLPNVRILATSRRMLAIDGEQIYPVPPLAVPAQRLSLSDLSVVPSVSLFVDRASTIQKEFKIGPDNAAAIAEICRRLDGLPLAIELAAAKVVTHSPAQILSKLGSSPDFLVSRKVDVSERHRSVRATLNWSLSLLAPELNESFAYLGVFRGGFAFDAGEAVTAASGFDEDLADLVGASLVQTESNSDPSRFRILEPIREHAVELLQTDRLIEARRRHFDHFLLVVNGLGTGDPSASNRAWLDTLNLEHENLCAAFESVFDGIVSPSEALDLFKVAKPFFRPRGRTAVWRGLLARLRDQIKDSDDLKFRAQVALLSASMNFNSSDAETVRRLNLEAMELCELAGDHEGVGQAHAGLGGSYKVAGDYPTSIEHYEKAVEAFKVKDDAKSLASTIRQMAMSYVSMGDHEMSYQKLQEALPYARRGGEPEALAWTLTDLAVEHAMHGLIAESAECFAEAHEICRSTDNSHMRSIVFWQQGEAELRTGRSEESIETHKECIQHALKAEFRDGLKWMLVSFGCALVSSGNVDLGTRVLARVARWRLDEKRPMTGDELEIFEPAKQAAMEVLGDPNFKKTWAEGEESDIDDMVQELLAGP